MRLSRYCRWASSVGLVIVMTPALADAQGESRTYTDSRGTKIVFPLGDASFADEIVSFDLGKPAPRDQRWLDAKVALGPPDYNPKTESTKASDVVLGCAGTLVGHFNDNCRGRGPMRSVRSSWPGASSKAARSPPGA